MTSAPRATLTRVSVRIRGDRLPGVFFPGRLGGDRCSDAPVHVGIQRGREVIDLVRGDQPEATFELHLDIAPSAASGADFRGPYVHGKRGERFLYLSWGWLDAAGNFEMFRRAKLHLSTIDDRDLQRAFDTGGVIEARLPLSDCRGGPICASVRPPTLRWSVA